MITLFNKGVLCPEKVSFLENVTIERASNVVRTLLVIL